MNWRKDIIITGLLFVMFYTIGAIKTAAADETPAERGKAGENVTTDATDVKPEIKPEIKKEETADGKREGAQGISPETEQPENTADEKTAEKTAPEKKTPRARRSLDVRNLEAAKTILAVEVLPSGDGAEVTVTADGLLMPDIFPLTGRLVIDAPGTRLFAKKGKPPAGYGLVEAVRWAQYPDKTRIVLDLKDGVSYRTALGGRTLVVMIQPKNERGVKGGKPPAETQAREGSNGRTADDKNEPDKNAAEAEYEPGLISLEFQNADLVSVIRFITDVSGYNVVVDSRIRGFVTLRLAEVPWEDALDAIISVYGLKKECKDNIIRITPTEEHLKGFFSSSAGSFFSDGRGFAGRAPGSVSGRGSISVNMDLSMPKEEMPEAEKSEAGKKSPGKKINDKK